MIKTKVPGNSGFTLIEVMIAITILAALTMLTSRAMRSGILNKQKFQGDIGREAAVRDAIRVMERDINLAYHYRDISAELMNQATQEAKQAANGPPPTDPAAGAPPPASPVDPNAPPPTTAPPALTPEELAALKKPAPQWTGLIGQANSLYFSTTSNVRMSKDALESDQAEVGYFLETCKPIGSTQASKCLIRSVATFIDDDLEKGGEKTVLLENVQDFKLRYIGPGTDEWQESWVTKTVKRTDGVELFPYAVEIYLKTHNKEDPKDKPFEMGAVAAVRFPNNDPKKEADAIANKK